MIGFVGYQRWTEGVGTPTASPHGLARDLADMGQRISGKLLMSQAEDEIVCRIGLAKSLGEALFLVARLATVAGYTLDEVVAMNVRDYIEASPRGLGQGVVMIVERQDSVEMVKFGGLAKGTPFVWNDQFWIKGDRPGESETRRLAFRPSDGHISSFENDAKVELRPKAKIVY